MANVDSTSRRTKVRGHPGVYYRLTGGRRRYEITYLDSDGRRRWQTVEGFDNLDDADATLEQIKGKKRRGERVAPNKKQMSEALDEWLAGKNVAVRTRERYESNVRLYLKPRFGRMRVQDITVDDVAGLLAQMRKDGRAEWTLQNVKVTLSGFFTWACSQRRGYAPVNPVTQLEADEKPKPRKRMRRTLQPIEITALLRSATTLRYRVLLAVAIFTGLRLMELLALRWQDVDFAAGEVRVRYQLTRAGKQLDRVKTESGERDIVLRPELAKLLKEHRMATRFKQPGDYVFSTETGGPLGWRNVERRAMDAAHAAAVKAKLLPADRAKPVIHDCRHTFGSMLIAEGHDVYTVSRAMGHANASTTLDLYTGEFGKQRNASGKRPDYGYLLAGLGNAMETTASGRAQGEAPEHMEQSGFGG